MQNIKVYVLSKRFINKSLNDVEEITPIGVFSSEYRVKFAVDPDNEMSEIEFNNKYSIDSFDLDVYKGILIL